MTSTIIAHLRLTRPANIVTAIADILAGFAVSGAALHLFSPELPAFQGTAYDLMWLIIATIGLYGGGVAFNDVFDAELDKIERPERPIPSGAATITSASIMGGLLLLIGILTAWQVSALSGVIALAVAALAILYNAWGKHQLIWGPINMGLCRGGNLLLGMSAVAEAPGQMWFLAVIPVVYIAAITMISRGEVHGGNRSALVGGAVMYALIILSVITLTFYSEIALWQVLPFIVLFSFFIFRPLFKALRSLDPHLVGKAVKAGVLSLIVLNASLATVYAGWVYGLVVLLLLPLSFRIGKFFAVT